MLDIRKAAVIGSGVMGGAIAAHLANAGLVVTLLDIVPAQLLDAEAKKGLTLQDRVVRNRIVLQAKEKMQNPKSMQLYTKANLERVTFGNLDDDLELLRQADWVVEAVVENLPIKKELFIKIAPYLKPNVILTSNTSGISVNAMSEVLPEELKPNFLITHFFNPPRHMRLLELIPSRHTAGGLLEYVTEFCEEKLGKGVVVAKDTPGFIANRVGTYALSLTIHKMLEYGLRFEEVDALTGSEIGRPNTGTFRLLDMVGLDTLNNVAAYLKSNVASTKEEAVLTLPNFIGKMLVAGCLGDKSKKGFYKKVEAETWVIDPITLEYGPKKIVESTGLAAAKGTKSLSEKLDSMIYAEDQAGRFVWDCIKHTLLFAASLIPAVANDATAIDNAMKWGYNWSVGPFELWDVIGVRKSVERMQAEGETIPALVTDLLAAGKTCFYDKDSAVTTGKKITVMQLIKQSEPILANADASLLDLGDGVACFVLHSPNSSITDNAIALMNQAISEVEANYRGMVIASSGKNFCVGANLQLVLGLAQAKNWAGLENLVSNFQAMNMNLKYCSKPVIATPYAMTLGAGAEMAMHARQVCVYGETYLGLVEIGVGLLPGGGGTKELLLRTTEPAQANANIDLTPFVSKAFEIISTGKVSASGSDAVQIGYLRVNDILVMNADSQLYQAKAAVLQQAQFLDPKYRNRQYRVGGRGLLALCQYALYNKKHGGFISPYDEYVAGKIAHVLCGGNVADNTLVTEQYLLDLEKEMFVSLCGEPKTQERMIHMLKTGKPLRN